jgi:nucleoside-diphosphate-sugar epimerase
MNTAVTGGNGFIGRKLVEALASQGHAVRVLTRASTRSPSVNVQFVEGDLTSDDCPFSQFLENCDVVFHCAGELRSVALMRALHVGGTRRLLGGVFREIALRGRAVHWVQLSSVGAYGFPAQFASTDRVVTEETPPQPRGEYEVTKTESDQLVIEASGKGILTSSVVRPSKVIGAEMPEQSLRRLGSMVRRGMFFYIGRPGSVATYVHVDDVVEVMLRCALDPRAKGKTFNISNDCTLEDMVNGIAHAEGVASPRLRFPESLVRGAIYAASTLFKVPLSQEQVSGLVRRTRYPYHKLQKELDFAPKRAVPNAIAEVLAH